MDIEIQDYEYRLNWKWSGQVLSERESCEENRLPNGINSRSERVAVTVGSQQFIATVRSSAGSMSFSSKIASPLEWTYTDVRCK